MLGPSSQVGDGEAVAQRVRVGTASEVGDAGVGQVAAKPDVYGRLVDRPARGPAVEHVVAALGGGVRGRDVGVEGRGEPTGDRDGPALAVLRVTDPKRPGAVSTSGRVRFSASETLSPAPYNTLNRTGSTSALFE